MEKKTIPKDNSNKDNYGNIERIPLKGIRKAAAEHLYKAHITTVPVTHIDEADVSNLVELRARLKEVAKKKGVHLTFLPFIVKAIVKALKNHPYINSSIEGEDIIIKKYYNIGVAIDTKDGLIVPVVKNVDSKDIFNLAFEIHDLAEKTRFRKIHLSDLKGGTITLTNVGSIGGKYSTPMMNYPESAIISLGRIDEKPIVKQGKVVIRKIMPICVTYDHRVVDGAEIARFVNDLIEYLENPNQKIFS